VSPGALIYVDSSAYVKLVLAEAETPALAAALKGAGRLVASEIFEVEVIRATRRGGGDIETARTQLEAVVLLPLSEEVRRRASDLTPSSLRSLDALHIATALDLGDRLAAFFTYDARMSEAARDAGLDVRAPA
jgi:uncharacterized protein